MEKNRAEKDGYADGGYEYGRYEHGGYEDDEYSGAANPGFLMVSRGILESAVWRNAFDAALYFYCLLKASYKDNDKVRAGCFLGSASGIGQDLGWTRNCVTRHMEQLCRMGLIQQGRKAGGTVYRIVGWKDICQGKPGPASWRRKGTASFERSASFESTASIASGERHGVTGDASLQCTECTPNEHVQINKKETRETRAREFETWWERYPRHSGKSRARQMWMTMTTPAAELNAALENAKRSPGWLSDNGRFIPAAENWLDGTWEDYAERQEEKGETVWKEY